MWCCLVASLCLLEIRRKIVVWCIFGSIGCVVSALSIWWSRSILIKGIACIVQSSHKFVFVILGVDIPCSSQYDHFYLIGCMSSHGQTHQSIVCLFVGIKMVEQCSHGTRLCIDITLGHCEVIGAKDTFAWTSKWLG